MKVIKIKMNKQYLSKSMKNNNKNIQKMKNFNYYSKKCKNINKNSNKT